MDQAAIDLMNKVQAGDALLDASDIESTRNLLRGLLHSLGSVGGRPTSPRRYHDQPRDVHLAKLVTTGPGGGEADYTDARYWAAFCKDNTAGADTVELAPAVFGGADYRENIVTVTNLTEIVEGSHRFKADLGTYYVPVFSIADEQTPTIRRYYFSKAIGAVPVGVVEMWAGDYDDVPFGYLFANGGSYSKSADDGKYLALWNRLGYKYGGADDDFNIPDTRAKYWRGATTDEARDNATDRGLYILDLDHDHDAYPNYTTRYCTGSGGTDVVGTDLVIGITNANWNGANDPPTKDRPDANSEITNEPPHWIGPGIIRYL